MLITKEIDYLKKEQAEAKEIKIALVGKMRSGKDTVGGYLVAKHGFTKFAFGSGIKAIINEYFPEAVKDGKKPRGHYQHIGQALRELNPDVWVNYLLHSIKFYKFYEMDLGKKCNKIVVTDCRQLNEAERLRAEGYTIVKIVAPEETRIDRIEAVGDTFTREQLHHDTEKQVDLIEPDYIIENFRSIEYLYLAIDSILEKLGGDSIG